MKINVIQEGENNTYTLKIVKSRYSFLLSSIHHIIDNTENEDLKLLSLGNIGYGRSGNTHQQLIDDCSDLGIFVAGIDIDEVSGSDFSFSNQHYGDFLEYEFDTKFDIIYMGEFLEHFWNPVEVFEKVTNILNKGGYVILDVPHVYNIVKQLSFSVFGNDTIGDPDHKIFYTPATLDNLLIKTGFQPIYYGLDCKPFGKGILKLMLNLVPKSFRGIHLLCVAIVK